MARPARRPGNLPAAATSFIGRRRELAEVRKKLSGARLVSLVGPGGVGKTRLAIRAATDLGRGFPDGAWLVELAEVTEPALIGNAVLAALDLRDQAAAEPPALLLSYLRDKRLLLVVDNCEHLVAAVAPLLTEIMQAAPDLRVLATSREPLSVPGEHVVPVPPLDLRTAHPAAALPQLRQNEAVMLFAERAAAAAGGFELTAGNQAAVVELCRRLDGLPLAIELAAVRTRVLTVQQILDRLTDRFGLLTTGGHAALPRHQTLRTTIDWSHDLLAADEQALLRRLYVFAGRFTLDDVEAVCTSDDVSAARALDVMSSLVDKSLVLKEDVKDIACYRLHETMREYAGLKARQAAEENLVELRCTEYYRGSCMRSVAAARYRLVEWLDWMDLEIDNVRSVLHRCVARHDTERGLDLAAAMVWYWITRATSEGIRWLDELLEPEDGNPPAHMLAHFIRGFLAVLHSDPAAACPALDRAAAAAQRTGQAGLHSLSLSMASIAQHMAGDRIAANRLLDEAHAISTDLGDFPSGISVLQARALHGLSEGDLDAVRSAASEGARRAREAGDLYSLGMMLLNLGSAALLGGDLEVSEPLLTEALRIARRIDDRVAQYALLYALGCQAAGSGRPRIAAKLLGAAETVQKGVGANVLPHLAPLLAKAEESATAALGTAAFRAEFEAGHRLSRDAAIGLALGESPPGAVAAVRDTGTPPLGKREAQVAHLVAEGMSNKQIGARLLISEHTVDTHIRNILNKLGFNSRAQIAAWMASSDQ
ncbi:MAG TPA: LuxR C-terminal-related transcriptional regulator [Streptosporangiaceae bacterium]|jgi:predicted ATPase/DNA-binding CsgD family transcriptional regulator